MDETRAQCLRLVWPSKRAKEMNRFSPFFSSESDVWSPARLMHLSGLRCIFKGLMKRILSKSGLMTILSKKQALYNLYIIKNHCCIINKLDRQNSIINRKNYQYISKWSLSFFTSVFLFRFNVQPQRFGSWRSCAVVCEALKWASVSGGLPRDEEGGQENPPRGGSSSTLTQSSPFTRAVAQGKAPKPKPKIQSATLIPIICRFFWSSVIKQRKSDITKRCIYS